MASVFDGASDPEVTFSMIETPSELNTGVNRLLPLAVVEIAQKDTKICVKYLNN